MFFEKLKNIFKYLIPIFYYAILFYLFSFISNLQLGFFESLKVTFLKKSIAVKEKKIEEYKKRNQINVEKNNT